MSYVPRLTAKVRRGLAALGPDLQELVLDEIERLVAEPGGLTFRGTGDSAVHDFIRSTGNSVDYVFVTVRLDEATQVLQIESVGHYARPL